MDIVDRVRADLARYYEHEATQRRRGPASGRRAEMLDEFVQMLAAERRGSVLDIGAGPGTDAAAFRSADIAYTGVDLAVGNGVLAAEAGVNVIAASLFDLAFTDATFDAGWSMSTLMHVPTDQVDAALRSICRVLVPGALLGIGQWGGSLGDIDSDHTMPGLPRLFSLRAAETNRSMLARHGSVERWEVWDLGPDEWEYHAAVVRLPE